MVGPRVIYPVSPHEARSRHSPPPMGKAPAAGLKPVPQKAEKVCLALCFRLFRRDQTSERGRDTGLPAPRKLADVGEHITRCVEQQPGCMDRVGARLSCKAVVNPLFSSHSTQKMYLTRTLFIHGVDINTDRADHIQDRGLQSFSKSN